MNIAKARENHGRNPGCEGPDCPTWTACGRGFCDSARSAGKFAVARRGRRQRLLTPAGIHPDRDLPGTRSGNARPYPGLSAVPAVLACKIQSSPRRYSLQYCFARSMSRRWVLLLPPAAPCARDRAGSRPPRPVSNCSLKATGSQPAKPHFLRRGDEEYGPRAAKNKNIPLTECL